MMHLSLQRETSTDLVDDVWTNAGDAVDWGHPAEEGKEFFGVHGAE